MTVPHLTLLLASFYPSFQLSDFVVPPPSHGEVTHSLSALQTPSLHTHSSPPICESWAPSCLFLHSLTQSQHDGCVGPFPSVTDTVMDVTGPAEAELWRHREFLALRLLAFWGLALHVPVSVCLCWKGRFWLKWFVGTGQDGRTVTSSVHWQVGWRTSADDI